MSLVEVCLIINSGTRTALYLTAYKGSVPNLESP